MSKKTKTLKANEDLMNEMHQMVAQAIAKGLQSDEPDIQMINAAMKFLKDNNVTADIEYSAPLQQLEQGVSITAELPFVEDEDEEV